jgi:hypothetical protein
MFVRYKASRAALGATVGQSRAGEEAKKRGEREGAKKRVVE